MGAEEGDSVDLLFFPLFCYYIFGSNTRSIFIFFFYVLLFLIFPCSFFFFLLSFCLSVSSLELLYGIRTRFVLVELRQPNLASMFNDQVRSILDGVGGDRLIPLFAKRRVTFKQLSYADHAALQKVIGGKGLK